MTIESTSWTMTEAARLLGEPQHRLIYLCEMGVVQPDVQDARGRGSSRRFSDRNLFEFAIALRLRDLEIAASFVGAILYVLRAFEGSVAKRISGFRLPGSLRAGHPPDIRLIISDEARLYFTLAQAGSTPKVYGGLDLREVASSEMRPRDLDRALAQAKAPEPKPTPSGLGGPEGSRWVRLEVSLTRIARELGLEG